MAQKFETTNNRFSIIIQYSFLLKVSFYKIKFCNKHILFVYGKWLEVTVCRKWQSNSAMLVPLFTSAIHIFRSSTFSCATTNCHGMPLFILLRQNDSISLSFANTGLLNLHLIIAKIS